MIFPSSCVKQATLSVLTTGKSLFYNLVYCWSHCYSAAFSVAVNAWIKQNYLFVFSCTTSCISRNSSNDCRFFRLFFLTRSFLPWPFVFHVFFFVGLFFSPSLSLPAHFSLGKPHRARAEEGGGEETITSPARDQLESNPWPLTAVQSSAGTQKPICAGQWTDLFTQLDKCVASSGFVHICRCGFITLKANLKGEFNGKAH